MVGTRWLVMEGPVFAEQDEVRQSPHLGIHTLSYWRKPPDMRVGHLAPSIEAGSP
jgi:hypothetical protein